MPEFRRHIICRIGLRAEMEDRIRQNFTENGDDSGIRHEKCVDIQSLQRFQKSGQAADIIVVSENIHRHIDFFSPGVGICRPFPDFLRRKVSRSGAQSEILTSEIHGIGPVIDGDLQFFQITGGRQQFHLFHSYRSSVLFLSSVIRFAAFILPRLHPASPHLRKYRHRPERRRSPPGPMR